MITTFRPAKKADARAIAALFQVSSGGVADYIWSQLAEDDESLIDVGEKRYAREGVLFSYQYCDIAEQEGRVVGMLHGFEMPEPDPDDAPEGDPVLRPYSELEIPGSYYISGIALFPDLRSGGIGTELMTRAHARARADGIDQASLIAFEQNARAVELYDRLGYKVVDKRPVVPHELIRYTGEALLMALDL